MISSRALELQPSATLKITGRAKELQREGKSIISLSAGEPDFLPQASFVTQLWRQSEMEPMDIP